MPQGCQTRGEPWALCFGGMVEIREGDALQQLQLMPEQSVQMCVTSPPYFGLRDYGVEGQMGLEKTPELFVAAQVAVFREVRRVLKDDGTLWLNIGDSYASAWPAPKDRRNILGQPMTGGKRGPMRESKLHGDLKEKDLIGIPWMLAFALRADGWYLRSDIIWHKPNAMPESVYDRPTQSHEHVFLLSKSRHYFYDYDAVKEPVTGNAHARGLGVNPKAASNAVGSKQNASFSSAVSGLVDSRNLRTVWTVATSPFSGAHFATFPPALIEPCIKAGSRLGDTVLDPFGGAGTTGLVADRLGRTALLIELKPVYAQMARDRTAGDASLFADVI